MCICENTGILTVGKIVEKFRWKCYWIRQSMITQPCLMIIRQDAMSGQVEAMITQVGSMSEPQVPGKKTCPARKMRFPNRFYTHL